MTSADSPSVDNTFLANAMAAFIQIAAVVLLIMWCFTIVSPFINVVVWALIISVAIYPAHTSLTRRLGGREKLSATLFVLVGLAIIVIPTWMLADSTLGALKHVSVELAGGEITVPQPADSVAEWPLIGEKTHAIWSDAATNLEATMNEFAPQIRAASRKAASLAGAMIGTALQFVVSMIIAGALLTSASSGYQTSRNIAASIAGVERGNSLTDLSIVTIRSVVKGVLGVALIQSALAAIGLLAMDIPAAGIWAGAILVLAIVQLPPLLILGPISVWVFSVADPVPATIFLIYSLIVSFSDAVLKPMLLGRGVEVPMLVILLGAIGGAITQGIIGLFIGSVVLALGYQIFESWMAPDESQAALEEA
jgi:predicted PurR-regulated permease PerM